LILDTNAVSALFAGDPALGSALFGEDRLHLPTVVVGEYRYGLARSRQARDLAFLLERLILDSIVLPIELATASHYAQVRDELRTRGTPIPENDVWIAALARQHALTILSRDEHFDRVQHIVRRAW
jgi:predicted nucleic acid-binding protein